MVIWITGLSGAGKSTIGRVVWERWRQQASNTVFVDGDEIRDALGLSSDEYYYTREGRLEVAGRICALCEWLDGQQINIVCCTISLFDEVHRRNRQNLSRYFEVFVDMPIEVLKSRDTKGLYASNKLNVVGIDLSYDVPAAPDMTIANSGSAHDVDVFAADILDRALGQ
jgi:adenylylsulfate kinase-like enzyme